MKPFLKWFGGKRQLLPEIEKYYCFDNNIKKYIEPFVGAGSVLFDILDKFKLDEIIISDTNPELINCYETIRDNPEKLMEEIIKINDVFKNLSTLEKQKEFYYAERKRFNENKDNRILKAAQMIFINKRCFNGLWRVNSKGEMNVSFGGERKEEIFERDNILRISEKLNEVKIYNQDYKEILKYVDEKTFVYLDPPYLPIGNGQTFTYSKEGFKEDSHIELARQLEILDKKGAKFLLSNSDLKNFGNDEEHFFDELYKNFNIKRVMARRSGSGKAEGRGKVKELLVSNIGKGEKYEPNETN